LFFVANETTIQPLRMENSSMPGQYTLEKIENWVSDFCLTDGVQPFSSALREAAGQLLVAFMSTACDSRGVEPEDIEEPDVKAGLLGPLAKLAVPEAARGEVPALCGAFLAYLQDTGRLGGGRMLGAYAAALKGSFVEVSSGKPKPIVRPGSKIGRNDPCPCGSGKKYKKCCMGK
jgi:hypothetical protein